VWLDLHRLRRHSEGRAEAFSCIVIYATSTGASLQELNVIMSENIVDVTDGSFETEVLQSQLPVLVDFWAEWCAPCRQLAPSLKDLADDFQGRLRVAKVNIDDNPATPGRYGIRGIPTLILFKNGQIEATKVGGMPKSKIYEWVESVV
jgi:thioredoxin 1